MENLNQQNNTNNASGTIPEIKMTPKNSIGPLVSALIVIALIALGGLYAWSQNISKIEEIKSENTEIIKSNTAQEEINKLTTQGTSDEVDSIKQDLDATNLDKIDSDVQSIQ
ncbi:MAG: hypothetical protein WCW87_00560 [Candidatus Paceibacterota bacterium]